MNCIFSQNSLSLCVKIQNLSLSLSLSLSLCVCDKVQHLSLSEVTERMTGSFMYIYEKVEATEE